MTYFSRLSLLALTLTVITGAALNATQASARSVKAASVPFSAINKSSPAAVRSYLTPYQKTTKSMGFYAPWAVQNPYGMRMLGNPAQRAVACGC
jgi:hypothetical protein